MLGGGHWVGICFGVTARSGGKREIWACRKSRNLLDMINEDKVVVHLFKYWLV